MKFSNFLKTFAIGLPIGITFLDCVGYIARVDGISMQPALNPDKHQTDYVFLNRWSVKSFNVQRGDIISLISPKDPSQKIIKRIVGVPADTIVTLSYKNHIVKIPEGHCWVEGDHTGHSMDSNNFGPVSIGLITAKASCIVWPPARWQFIQSFLPDSRNVTRNSLTLGDVDNDGCNELVIGNSNGDLTIFKGRERFQTIKNLSLISCVAIGDVLNQNRNCLVVITADGWCYVYSTPTSTNNDNSKDNATQSGSTGPETAQNKKAKIELVCIHIQRIPANAKNILLGDIDGDGLNEMILGLTDRVVRSYRWVDDILDNSSNETEKMKCIGQFTALNKWECANQIGSITLHHSKDDSPSLLVAQPGGTFMRIQCQPLVNSLSQNLENLDMNESNSSENLTGSVIDYQSLGISRMRNPNISTEILGDFRIAKDMEDSSSSSVNSQKSEGNKSKIIINRSPYAVATLDGTIMLVQDEVILWAIAVDHQIFALTKLDVTGNGVDDIVACSWDGQTYILDQEKNSIRFHLNESVQAFDCGYYNLSTDQPPVTCLVYVTFKNTILIYYNIPLKELICQKFEPDSSLLAKLFMNDGKTKEEALDMVEGLDKKTRNNLVQFLLYNKSK